MAMSTEEAGHLATRERQVLWVSGYYREQGLKPGSFYEYLINAFFKADLHNRGRLSVAFPVTAQAYENYMTGKLKKKYSLKDE
jgi:hypothetical protein